MDAEDRIYRELQQHLDKSPAGFAATDSGADIRLLKHLLTPEEAKIATLLSNIRHESLDTILKKVRKAGMDISLDELREKLDVMVHKGTIRVFSEGLDERRYKNVGVSAGGMIDFQVNRLTQDLVADLDKYHEESFALAAKSPKPLTPQLRTIPVEKSVPMPDKRLVNTYDDVRKLVEQSPGPFSVANCVCRQMKDLRGQNCRYSDMRETCLQIGPDHSRQYVEMGIARFIPREEVYEILDKAQDAGFILQPENAQHPENICCCCGDCCGPLTAAKKAPRPADLYSTNYYVEVDITLCDGCKTCIERCQMDARVLVDDKSAVDLDRCIGCGNCVVSCKPGATRLVRKEGFVVPPKEKNDTYMKILSEKNSAMEMLKLRLKMLLGMRV